MDDLTRLNRRDPQILRWALKKMLVLERDPEAGAPLVGQLAGWRKITVGDRDWRIVWRVTHDDSGVPVVDVAEVWAAGARSDGDVYAEMTERVAGLPASPRTTALAAVIEQLAATTGLTAAPEPTVARANLPTWLRDNLVEKVQLSPQSVDALTWEQAVETWNAWTSRST